MRQLFLCICISFLGALWFCFYFISFSCFSSRVVQWLIVKQNIHIRTKKYIIYDDLERFTAGLSGIHEHNNIHASKSKQCSTVSHNSFIFSVGQSLFIQTRFGYSGGCQHISIYTRPMFIIFHIFFSFYLTRGRCWI